MKKIKVFDQYIKGSITEEELEAFTQAMVKEHFDKEKLQKKWSQVLQQEHDFQLDKSPVADGYPRKKRIRLILSVAASFLLLLSIGLSYQWLSVPGYEKLIGAEFDHPYVEALSRKGSDDALRLQAIAAYNNRNYQAALGYFEQLAKKGQAIDWDFYIGLCHLFQGQTDSAIESLLPILKDTSGKYITEVNWYLGLAYVLNKEFDLAQQHLEWVANRSDDELAWKVKEAKALLNALSEQE